MPERFNLKAYGINVERIIRNPSPPMLYEYGLRDERGTAITAQGALIAMSGDKTGRSPKDKRLLREPSSEADIWWGDVNMPVTDHTFQVNRGRAVDYLNTRDQLYCIDGYAGWDPNYRIKVRVVCARAYHALFMHNMLITPGPDELDDYGVPDYVILNAGQFPANRFTDGVSSATSVTLSFSDREMVILGTEYAGEMKKGVFTIMNYLMPKRGVLSMHCSAVSDRRNGQTAILFGLSGTGKTTLSASPDSDLIGDDEHGWSDEGLFNIEGGCYAKMINLSAEEEPEIYSAIRFGTVLENVVYDPQTREVDFADTSITKNTRGSYPIEYIDNAKLPCVGDHPKNVIFLTADAFGVLPPVAKLNPNQAMYHFISGYTARVAGTEVGVVDPEATFSPCFGGPFLVWHPVIYARLLAAKLEKHGAQAWLVNTGWSGGPFGIGERMALPVTRRIVDAIQLGELDELPTRTDPVFGFEVPLSCPGVDADVLDPKKTWTDPAAYDAMAKKLAGLFRDNFRQYRTSDEIVQGGPKA